jgi:hypothetical protein
MNDRKLCGSWQRKTPREKMHEIENLWIRVIDEKVSDEEKAPFPEPPTFPAVRIVSDEEPEYFVPWIWFGASIAKTKIKERYFSPATSGTDSERKYWESRLLEEVRSFEERAKERLLNLNNEERIERCICDGEFERYSFQYQYRNGMLRGESYRTDRQTTKTCPDTDRINKAIISDFKEKLEAGTATRKDKALAETAFGRSARDVAVELGTSREAVKKSRQRIANKRAKENQRLGRAFEQIKMEGLFILLKLPHAPARPIRLAPVGASDDEIKKAIEQAKVTETWRSFMSETKRRGKLLEYLDEQDQVTEAGRPLFEATRAKVCDALQRESGNVYPVSFETRDSLAVA